MTRHVAGPAVPRTALGASLLPAAWLSLAAMLPALPESEEALCRSCHETTGAGAAADVETGVRDARGDDGPRGRTAAGSLR